MNINKIQIDKFNSDLWEVIKEPCLHVMRQVQNMVGSRFIKDLKMQ